MIQYYQELLNECIDLQEHYKILHIFKELSKRMKGVSKDARITRTTRSNKVER
jgi:hypothetical protein